MKFILILLTFSQLVYSKPRLFDERDFLTPQEHQQLLTDIQELYQTYGISFNIVIHETLFDLPPDKIESARNFLQWHLTRTVKGLDKNGIYLALLTSGKYSYSILGNELAASGRLTPTDRDEWVDELEYYRTHGKLSQGIFSVVQLVQKKLSNLKPGQTQAGTRYLIPSDYGKGWTYVIATVFFLFSIFFAVKIWRDSHFNFTFSFLSLLSFSLALAFCYFDVFFDPSVFLPRDNYDINYLLFDNLAQQTQYFGSYPNWVYTKEGGVWVEPLSNNYLTLLPYRFVAIHLSAILKIPANLLYKISFLILGRLVFSMGAMLLFIELFRKPIWALLLTLFLQLTAFSGGIFHQEQALATVFYIPWIFWALMKCQKEPRYLVLAATLFGLALNCHYPQLLFCYFAILMISVAFIFLLAPKKYFTQVKTFYSRFSVPILCLSALSFILTSSPLVYSYFQYSKQLASPFRGQNNAIMKPSYEEYLSLRDLDSTSLRIKNMGMYLGWNRGHKNEMGSLDEKNTYVGSIVPVVLCLAIIFGMRFGLFQLGALIGLALLTIGTHGPMPALLWNVIPGIGLFRQWYHFSSILNFHLIILSGFVAISFMEKKSLKTWQVIGCAISAFVLSALSLIEVLPWAEGYGGATLLLLRLGQNRLPAKQILPISVLALVASTSFYWLNDTVADVRMLVRKQTGNSTLLDFGARLFTDGRGIFKRTLANPIGADVFEFGHLSSRRMAYWIFSDGSRKETSEGDLEIEKFGKGFQIKQHPPKDAAFLEWVQFNDGRFLVNGSPVPRTEGNTLRFTASNKIFTLERSSSVWQILIYLIWLPLFGFLAYECIPLKKLAFYPVFSSG